MKLFGLPSALAALTATVSAIEINIDDPSSIASAAKTCAQGMLSYYTGNQPGGTPGILPQPYYWWEAGEMMGALIDYWYYTGDTEWNDLISSALVFQYSPTYDFMPPNQTKNEGNDDQIFWGFAVMSAAEYRFPNPPDDVPSWISVAEAVYNSQYVRWDTSLCNGGLRWQIFEWNNGWNYKNSPSNGGFINLAARLYAYTGNSSYSDAVTQWWNWMDSVGLYNDQNFQIYDGTNALINCTQLDHVQWSYSAGMMINAAAVMWNVTNGTEQAMWQARAEGIWNSSSSVFFKDKVMYESACEPQKNCNLDQQSFKAPFSRFLAASMKVAPFLFDSIQPYLQASAQAAAAQCSGNGAAGDGTTCGTSWLTNGQWDGTSGVGQQMTALEVIGANLIKNASDPVTENNGGLSHGNATLGTGDGDTTGSPITYAPITTGDRAGAGILTAIVIVGILGGGWWIVS